MKHRPHTLSLRRALGVLAGAGLGGSFLHTARAQAAGATLHFYSPETNINNFGTLKREFEAFFATAGGHQFQPYGDRAAFEKALEGNPGVFLLSSWHYPQLAGKSACQPRLVGQLQKKSSQRHVLCAKKPLANLAALGGMKIAASGSKDFTLARLADLLTPKHRALLPKLHLLPVPKDLDALMALHFDLVQAAVVTESGLAQLALANPTQHAALVPLAHGPERLLPLLLAPAQPDAASQALLQVLAAMSAAPAGLQCLRLLGLEGLAPFTDTHRKLLSP